MLLVIIGVLLGLAVSRKPEVRMKMRALNGPENSRCVAIRDVIAGKHLLDRNAACRRARWL